MKSLFIFSLFLLATNALDEEFLESARQKVKKSVEECVEEQKATQQDFDNIMNLKIPESHEGKCVYFCAHKKFNLQNDDGTLNKEGAMATFEILKDLDADFHDKILVAYNNCLPTPADKDPCLYSVNFFQCLMTEATKVGVHELIIK